MNTEGNVTTYMTGNKWPKDVEKFQISAFGFQDYNSADIIVTKNRRLFYGVSLKKKQTVKAQDPTLINKAFASAFDGQEFSKLKKRHRNLVFQCFPRLTPVAPVPFFSIL